jgi:hypothetical protein
MSSLHERRKIKAQRGCHTRFFIPRISHAKQIKKYCGTGSLHQKISTDWLLVRKLTLLYMKAEQI